MDDDLQNLEAELKRLRPVAPPPAMLARIKRELGLSATAEKPAPARTARVWWLWAGALPAAAAALVLALVVTSRQRTMPVSPVVAPMAVAVVQESTSEVFKPVTAENVLYAVADEGLVTLADGTAARRERLNYVDTITWKNPRTNASVQWTVPREEVRVVPVKFQ